MDSNKRKALIEWVNSLVPSNSIRSVLDLQDGKAFIQLLQLSDECLVPEAPQTSQQRLDLVKQYLEGFYSVSLLPGSSLLDFKLIVQDSISRKDKEWELGKILLALLEACVLEKKNNTFVTTATSLPELVQMEIMQMLQPMIINAQDVGSHLTEDFADILTKTTDTNAHQDAALFFQLVTQGNMSRVTSTPNVDHSFNFSRFSNHVASPVSHQQFNTSLSSEIASPLRMMTIANSPCTPLSALMQSPQLAQKALIRQREREIKKLELSLQNERHLRTELEFDLHEKVEKLNDKDNKIKEFEKVVKQQRKVQDMVDEIDTLRQEKEKNEKDLTRVQQKMNELQNIKDHYEIVEQENKQLTEEFSKMRTEVQTMDSLKKSHEEYRTQCHLKSVRLSELESLIQHKNSELESKNIEMCHSEEKNRNLISQIDSLKKDQEEFEELLSCRGAVNGESMGVISDKRIKELEDEMAHMKSSWVELSAHEQLQQKLDAVSEARNTFEAKFSDVHKQFLEKDSRVDQLQLEVSQLKSSIEVHQENQTELVKKVNDAEQEINVLRQSEAKLISSEESAIAARKAAEEQILTLQKDQSRLQTEFKLTVQELEGTKQASENRRQTMAASIDVALSEKKTLEQRLLKSNQKLEEQVTELKAKLQKEHEESAKSEEALKSKVQALQLSLKQTEILLENDQWTKDNTITAMREELKEIQEELTETENKLQIEIAQLTENKNKLEDQIAEQKDSYVQKIDNISSELLTFKTAARQKENDMCDKLQSVKDENIALKNELDNLKAASEKSVSTMEQKYCKFENKAKDQEESLRKELKALQGKYQWSQHDQESLTEEISDLKDLIKEKCLEIENLQSEILNHKQCENDLKGQVSQITNSKENLQKQLEEMKENMSVEQENHAELVNKISQEHETEIQKLRNCLSAKEASSLDTQQNMETCMNEIQTSLEKEMERGKEKERLCQIQIAQTKNQLAELQGKYDKQTASHNTIQTTLNNKLEQQRITTAVLEEKLNKEVQKGQAELSKVTAEYNELDMKYRSVTDHERTRDSRMKELHQQISELESRKRDLENLSEEKNEKVDDLTGQIVLIKKVAESKQADNDKLCLENKNLNVKVEDLNEKLLKECKENDEMRHKHKEINCHVNQLENQLCEVNNKLVDTEKVLEEKSSSLSREVEAVSERDAEISDLKISLQNTEEEVLSAKEQVSELTEENSELNKSLENMNNELKNLQTIFNNKKIELNEKIQTLLESHKNEILELKESSESEIKVLNSEIEKMKSDLLSCDTEILRLEQENRDLKSSLELLKEEHLQELEQIHSEKETVLNECETRLKGTNEKLYKEKNELIESHKMELQSLNSEFSESKQKFENTIVQLKEQSKNDLESLKCEFKLQVERMTTELKQEHEKMSSLKKDCKVKVSETEKYWQSQLEQLQEEYAQASDEQKQEYDSQVQEQEVRYQSQYEALVQEREMILSNQKMAFQERVNYLENRLTQRQTEIQTLTKEMDEDKGKTETDYKQKLANIESILKKEMSNQKDLMNELKQNKERVNELQSALREKRTSYETSLKASKNAWDSDLDNLREEYNGKMSELEREKNRQIEDEKQRRINMEESCHHLEDRMETSLLENNSLKQQLAAVEEEKNQLILDYEKTLDLKNNDFSNQEQLKKKIEMFKSQVQKLEVEKNFHRDQLDKKVKELKEELEYKEEQWSEEMESVKKQYTEANQQKIHLQQQMKNIGENTDKKDKTIAQYQKYYAQKKETNLLLQQEVNINKKLADNFKEKTEKLEAEINKLKNNYKAKSEKMEKELEQLKVLIEEQKNKFSKTETEVAPVKSQLQEELNKNKSLQNKVKTLEVQLDYADKQVRELRHKLDDAGTVFLGDNTEFMKLKKESDVSLMETSFRDDGGPLTPYNLRSSTSRKFSLERNPSQSSLQHLCKSDGDEKSISPLSLRSHGRRSSLSDPNLNATIASIDSVRSTTSKGMKRFVNDEDDEGEVLEWKRLGELSRRNTLCLPHLKTSYPVETQKIQLRVFPDRQLQQSHLSTNSLKKRKQELVDEDDIKTEFYDSTKNKQAKHVNTVYQKPGPPTPGNSNKRNSRGTPGRGLLNSPRSPMTSGRRRTPKRTPKKTPKKETNENVKPATTFSIGFTPKNKRLTRQHGFVSASKSSTKRFQTLRRICEAVILDLKWIF
ncbi:putative leucine-rich repeat-containing protein DDB_G0290503 isoform X1 [Mytilus edulis]|uniref:putative leucine-rich repeat-containing protein DDB_G0290503 isoform X1 n=1 Tax=Mytilus edulis TaxID=6550 RepID=UPI0039EDF1DD